MYILNRLCVLSEAVCMLLLMFSMSAFHTHQSETSVPTAHCRKVKRVSSKAVCMLLLMFSMSLFNTHQSQTGVPIAEECSVYLLNKLLAAACLLQVREADRLID